MPVHPHARGEHIARAMMRSEKIGSSPRAWGTRHVSAGSGVRRRFIPTRVGNTKYATKLICKYAVHPHARGEHVSILK